MHVAEPGELAVVAAQDRHVRRDCSSYGCSAVDKDDSAVAQSREVVHGHPDAGVVVAADGVHELIDFVAEKAYRRRLAGISRQVLVSSADRPRTELLSGSPPRCGCDRFTFIGRVAGWKRSYDCKDHPA